jgi:ElaB/YqjD/DUF883 family membrane-anchored ribosome-binding protein
MPKAEDASEQIAKLREQVEMLMKDRITPALQDAAGRAETAMGAVKHQADAVSGQVRSQPLIAILIATAIGFALGRVLR